MAHQSQVLDLLELCEIHGTQTHYSDPGQNSLLGLSDRVVVFATVIAACGAHPTLSVVAEDSSDGEHWAEVNRVIDRADLGEAPLTLRGHVAFPHGRFLRFAISVGGDNPAAAVALKATLLTGVKEVMEMSSPVTRCPSVRRHMPLEPGMLAALAQQSRQRL